jgi:hypothetical protein
MTCKSVSEANCAARCAASPFEVAAKADIVEHRLVVIGEQTYQRIRERAAKDICHVDSRPGACCQQALVLQIRDGFAHRRARHAELFGQIAFGRQAFARTQDTAQDKLLYLPADGRRQALRGHGLKRHRSIHSICGQNRHKVWAGQGDESGAGSVREIRALHAHF